MKTYIVKIDTDRTEWYLNGKLHREDGPAVEWRNGYKVWFLNGQRHREDGPAMESSNGYKEWWLHDEQVTEEEHRIHTQKTVELTLDEIAEQFGIPVEKLKVRK